VPAPPTDFYAHSLPGQPPEKWQKLEEHLKNVAKMAAEFAKPFGGEEWAYLAGLWHDLGKYSNEFQEKLYRENGLDAHIETRPGRVVHSEAGGHVPMLKGWKGLDRLLSWLIMGHHAGLADFWPDRTGARALEPKMKAPELSARTLGNVPHRIIDRAPPRRPVPAGADPAFFIRMLFSCLVDADFLDTEAFMNRRQATIRGKGEPSLEELSGSFEKHMADLCRQAPSSDVNEIRKDVLVQCRQAARERPNVYSLTVPTGGGKTLSSLAFALLHALEHGKVRIIYVIPYTSIIEQTAAVFRAIPDFKDAVIEHHCNVSIDDEERETSRSRLAAENWDAPIVVTTAVQFFESLYACKSSRCRKLHNIVNSVVIFDEAQCLPTEYLRPAVFAIRELQRHYGVTPVLCTATLPVLTKTERFDFRFREGFDAVSEIIDRPTELSERLKRVQVSLHAESLAPVTPDRLATALVAEGESVLCIDNRKDNCRELAHLLPAEHVVHLSTNMCAEHRLQTLNQIRLRLREADKPFIVVSTSLVEAGVDLDFPVVYRALAGLDSIAQAAGRCNREGRMAGMGRTVVFVPEGQPAYVRQPAGIASEFLKNDLSGLLSPPAYERYFRQRFWQLGADELDKYGILALLSGRMVYYYRTAAEMFRLIQNDWQEPVIAPYGKAQELIDRMIQEPWMERLHLRQLQRYVINIDKRLHDSLVARDYVHEVSGYPGLFTLSPVLYDNRFGFIPPDENSDIAPEEFMA